MSTGTMQGKTIKDVFEASLERAMRQTGYDPPRKAFAVGDRVCFLADRPGKGEVLTYGIVVEVGNPLGLRQYRRHILVRTYARDSIYRDELFWLPPDMLAWVETAQAEKKL